MRPCGTEAAYYRHRYRGEEPCLEDRKAAADASRDRERAKGRPEKRRARHGTTSRYVAGCRCVFCRDAHAEYMRAFRKGKRPRRPKERAWAMRDEVFDFLELEGWSTAVEIADRFGRNVDSVERTLRKLRDDGLIESKQVEMAYASNGTHEARTEWRAS